MANKFLDDVGLSYLYNKIKTTFATKKEVQDAIANVGSGGNVNSVNGKTGDVTITAEDIGALPNTTEIPTLPTNISAFINDVGYLTEHQSLENYALKTDLNNALGNIDAAITQINTLIGGAS